MLSSVGYIRGRGRQFLVAPSVLSSPLTLSRAQVSGVQSSAISGDGSSVALYNADTPRFTGSAQRLLIEGQRTNSIRNPRCEGAVAGTPGTAPANWAMFGTGGVDFNIVGTGTENNLPYVDIRMSGTSTTGASPLIRTDLVYPVASVGQVWTHSMYARLISGSLTGITDFRMYLTEWTSGGVFLGQTWTSYTLTFGALSGARLSHTGTLTIATTGIVGSQFDFAVVAGVPIDCTFRVAAPQLELGAFASSPILPPVGTPGASTRGTDFVSATLASLGVTTGITMLWSGLIPAAPAVAGEQTILHIDDGTLNSRYRLINEGGSGNILLSRSFGGGAVNAVTPGGVRPTNSIFKIGMSVNIPAGTAISSLNGGAVATVTGGATSGLTHFRLGNALAAAPLFGETAPLRVLPYATSSSDLQSLVSALP